METFWLGHPFWAWLAAAAVLLAAELMTGSGWLLWPAGAAAAVAFVTLAAHQLGLAGQAGIFAILAAVGTLAARPWARGRHGGHDINDQHDRLVGHAGRAAGDFMGGRGRVLVDGKEWSAELDGSGILAAGSPVTVTAVVGGARLKVRAT